MELSDRTSIQTPEGVRLDITLAGLGSRFGAAVIDSLIVGFLLLLAVFGLGLVGSLVGEQTGLLFFGIASVTVTLILGGYYVAFETWNGGRTPGKAAFGLRVLGVDGEPASFLAIFTRNLLRLVDLLPAAYAVGSVSILLTERNQRLGDLASRTIVVRDRIPAAAPGGLALPAATDGLRWDVSAVTADEVALIRRFLHRRSSLTPDRREQIAGSIAAKIRPKVGGVEMPAGDEDFLSRLLSEKLRDDA